jgi:excisionase family DNA binding protein
VSDTPSILTPTELAAHFKTSKQTVLQWYHKGLIPAEVATGSVYRFDLAKVQEALAAKATTKPKRRPFERTRGGMR